MGSDVPRSAQGPDQAETIGGLSPDPDAADREQDIAVGQPPQSNLFPKHLSGLGRSDWAVQNGTGNIGRHGSEVHWLAWDMDEEVKKKNETRNQDYEKGEEKWKGKLCVGAVREWGSTHDRMLSALTLYRPVARELQTEC